MDPTKEHQCTSDFVQILEIFTKNNMIDVPHPPCFSMFSRLKIKLKGRNFDTIDVTEAESQAVPNTLTKYDFQDAFKNTRNAVKVHTCGRGLLRGRRWPVGAKLVLTRLLFFC
jgi:hypothetical protein